MSKSEKRRKLRKKGTAKLVKGEAAVALAVLAAAGRCGNRIDLQEIQ